MGRFRNRLRGLRDRWRAGTIEIDDVDACVPGSLTPSMQIRGVCAMRSSGAVGSIRPMSLKPGRLLVVASSARFLEQQSTEPPLGQPQQEHPTGTTTWASGSGARLSPEPARSRARGARTKRPGLSMMSMVGAGMAPDTTAALVLAHTRGRQRRWLVWSAPERLWEESRQTRLLRCMSPELAHRLMIIGRVGFRRVAGGTRTCVGEAVQLCLDLARILLPALTSAGRTITARDCKPDGEDRPASRRRRCPNNGRAVRHTASRCRGRVCTSSETARARTYSRRPDAAQYDRRSSPARRRRVPSRTHTMGCSRS